MTSAFAAQEAVSRTAGQVDALFYFIAGVSLFFFLLVEGLLIYFAVKYRRRRGEEAVATSDAHSNVVLETIWVVIPSVVVVAFFYYGYVVFRDIHAPLPGASDVHVTARQFVFQFRYPDGRTEINELRVPVQKPVKLVLSSEDVIHSFYVPAFRIKQDMVPGQYTYLWLEPEKTGTYDIYCAEYCGVGHSTMRASLVVMPQAEYLAWTAGREKEGAVPLAARGKELVERSGCLGCHSLDGTAKVGPTFQGLYGRTVTLADGRTVTADEEYIRESLIDPAAKLVQGFPDVMPTFKTALSADDIGAVIAYLKAPGEAEAGEEARGEPEEREEAEEREGREAKAAPPSPARGRELAEKYGCLGCHSTDGSVIVGPTWKGLFGREVPLEDGSTATANEEYIRESVYDPGARIVKGFPAAMPSFRGTVSEEDLSAIVAYIRTLR